MPPTSTSRVAMRNSRCGGPSSRSVSSTKTFSRVRSARIRAATSGLPRHRVKQIADQECRRLASCDHQRDAEPDDLLRREPLPVHFGAQQRRDEILGVIDVLIGWEARRALGQPRGVLGEPGRECRHHLLVARDALFGGQRRGQHERVGPPPESDMVAVGQSQQAHHGPGGNLGGEPHDLHVALAEVVEQMRDQLVEPALEPLDPAREKTPGSPAFAQLRAWADRC